MKDSLRKHTSVSPRKYVALFAAVVTSSLLTLLAVFAPPAAAAPTPAPASGLVQFAEADYVTDESAGTVTLAIERVGGSAGEITATIQTHDGTATIVDDYAGIPSPLTLTWSDGNTSPKTVTLPIKSDTVVEPNETFTMDIVSAHAGTPSVATITILGSVPPPPTPTPTPTPATPTPPPVPPATPTPVSPVPPVNLAPTPTAGPEVRPAGFVEFAAAGYTVTEDQCTVAVELQRVNGKHGAVAAVVATNSGNASAGSDYVPILAFSPVTVTWADGDTASKVVLIKLIADEQRENDESFTVLLLSTTGAGQGVDTTSVVIADRSTQLADGKLAATCANPLTDSKGAGPEAVGRTRDAKVLTRTTPSTLVDTSSSSGTGPVDGVSVTVVVVLASAAVLATSRRNSRLTR